MSLASLTVQNLRGLRQADLELHPRHNLIHGANGSGKTSLLEAIFLLGRGRSFRTRNSERLITWGEPRLVVFGRTPTALQPALGVQISRGEATVAKIGGEFVRSLADLSQALPVQVIEPGVHKLVEEGAFRRRRWLDWAVFHVEHGFMATWSSYARALKQRNAALRRDVPQVAAWDAEIARLGESLAASRRAVLERLQPYWHSVIEALGLEVELAYFQGWSRDLTLAEALVASRDRDVARGQTHAGPHRGDVLIRLGGPGRSAVRRRGQNAVAPDAAPVDAAPRAAEAGYETEPESREEIAAPDAAARPRATGAVPNEALAVPDAGVRPRVTDSMAVPAAAPVSFRAVVPGVAGGRDESEAAGPGASSEPEPLRGLDAPQRPGGGDEPEGLGTGTAGVSPPERPVGQERLRRPDGVAGRLARETLSRGQQKLVAVSLILSQLQLLQDVLPQPPILLLDDPAAELDSTHLAAFIAQLAQLRGQLVLTSLSAALSAFGSPDRVFHVEQGRVKTL